MTLARSGSGPHTAQRRPHRPAASSTHNTQIGAAGEDHAARMYESSGARVLARNVRYRCGELDLVVEDLDGTIVFVEVKTRTGTAFGCAESVTPRKLLRMHRAALRWLERKPYTPIRFDVVLISPEGVELISGVDHGAC
ncbi:hypothetical protein CCICO_07295 [Corynebacterium ciconiae DSM 44920]|uniref:YraN family protein n=1 Tax=Corynebacterium ciconiae TaxID=227319 RepID=UPI000A00736F|nr:YraN family protein [Corynebacterium ciconiae]WKD61479.1 hypothetical protein CCICO_07295 [Corynebacterium ciconiae DSM 44920]